jgi:ABC-type lipoprotein release transport system permease subunit
MMLTELDQQLILANLEEIQDITTMEPGNAKIQIAIVNSMSAIIWHKIITNGGWSCTPHNEKFHDWVGLHSLSTIKEVLEPHLDEYVWGQIEERYRSITYDHE